MRTLNHFQSLEETFSGARESYISFMTLKNKQTNKNRIFQEVENNCQSLHPQTIITYSKPSLQEYVKSKL